jgi:membrane protein DedA with SNARE-associated domain
MDFTGLVERYGYTAILVGTFFEGETILVVAGIAAHQGLLQLPWVMVYAFAGSLTGDQLWFLLGRLQGRGMIDRRPKWQRRLQRVHDLLERHRVWFILVFRFLYGLRSVAPFVIGTSRVPVWQFVLLNVLGAVIWAAGLGTLSYYFGAAIEAGLHHFQYLEIAALIALAVGGALVVWLRQRRNEPPVSSELGRDVGAPPAGDDPGRS